MYTIIVNIRVYNLHHKYLIMAKLSTVDNFRWVYTMGNKFFNQMKDYEILIVIIAVLLLTWGFVVDYRNHKKYNSPKDPYDEYIDQL